MKTLKGIRRLIVKIGRLIMGPRTPRFPRQQIVEALDQIIARSSNGFY